MTDPSGGGTSETGRDLDGLIAGGRRHRAAGRFAEAEAAFTVAHGRFPDATGQLVQRGAIRVLEGRYVEALQDYEQARRLDPAHPGLDSYVAEVFLYTGRAREALVLSEAAAVREPGDLMHRINIAHAHLQQGEVDAALERYRALADEVHPTKRRTGRELVLEDFGLFDAAGLRVADIDRARRALARATP